MGLFSDIVADSRPRSWRANPSRPAGPAAGAAIDPAIDPTKRPGEAGPETLSNQERSTMSWGVEERTDDSASVSRKILTEPGRAQDFEPRQGVTPSLPQNPAAAVSRTDEGVIRYRKGKRSTEQGTTDGQNGDYADSENELLGDQNRQERTTSGLHVGLDAHASVPSFPGQTAVVSGAPFKSEAELSVHTDSRSTYHLSTGSHGETQNGTAVLEGRQNPGKALLPPQTPAVVPPAVKPEEAMPLKELAAGGGRERGSSKATNETFSIDRAADAGRPSPPAPLPAAHPDPRERGEALRSTISPSDSTSDKGSGERASRSGERRELFLDAAPLPSLRGKGGGEWDQPGPGVRAAGEERQAIAPPPTVVSAAPPPLASPALLASVRREPPRAPAGPRVQIGRVEVIVTAPAPPPVQAAPAAAPSPKPGALASRRYLRSL